MILVISEVLDITSNEVGEWLKLWKIPFFRIDKEDIITINHLSINELNYGKLHILNDGSVYSNNNKQKIGSIYKETMIKHLNKLLLYDNSWFDLRKNHKPCKNCVQKNICPPINNYEYYYKIGLCK